MNILYFNYWGGVEGITVGTVYPCLYELAGYEDVEKIYFFSVERNGSQAYNNKIIQHPKIQPIPCYSKEILFNSLSRALDSLRIFAKLFFFLLSKKVDVVVCRSSMGAIFGVFANVVFGKPFIVEYYEPHADYMAESGAWPHGGLKYRFQRFFEKLALKRAKALLPVSMNYQQKLIREGADAAKIAVFPCTVDVEQFKFSPEKRAEFRQKLKIEDKVAGVYVGKFGGIYYDEEAFHIFKLCYDYFKGRFHLILLSPTPADEIKTKLQAVGFPLENVTITLAAHHEVPYYLSASDFALSTIRPCESRKYCSPIKDGEYWANGLPILLPPDIGDDSQIILTEGVGGAVFEYEKPETLAAALKKLEDLAQENNRDKTVALAKKYRHFGFIQDAYKKFLRHKK